MMASLGEGGGGGGNLGSFSDVWGSNGSDVFVTDLNIYMFSTNILHYDGFSWENMNYPPHPGYPLRGIWGSGSNDVFAVGRPGIIYHYNGYNGTSWTTMNSGSRTDLKSVWGSSGSDVFVVGNNGTILHRSGGFPWILFIPAMIKK